MSKQKSGLGSGLPKNANDAEQSAQVELYNVTLAESAEQREREMTFGEALKADRRLIMYSIGFSGTIIMEGYGLALMTYLFTLEPFNRKYGVLTADGKYEVEYIWKVLLPLTAQIGSIIGIFVTTPCTKWFGYKWTTLLMLIFSATLVAMPFFAPNIMILCVGFFLQGIPWGVFQVVSPAYASEVSTIQLRPILTTWNNLCWVIGQLLSAGAIKGFSVAFRTEWAFRIPFGLQWIFTFLLAIGIWLAPESPYWYIQKGEIARGRQAIVKLVRKGDPSMAEEKLALMQHTIQQEHTKDAEIAQLGKWERIKLMLKGSDARRTEIACIAWTIQAMCGSSIIAWGPKLFENSGLDASQSLSVNMALPAAGLLGTLASWWLMAYVGRRSIYFYGLLVMALLLVACGGASYAPANVSGWAAGGVLTVYTMVYDLTVGPICYSIVSEIPSIRYRAVTLSAARGAYLGSNLINHFLTPKMLSAPSEGGWGLGSRTGFVYAVLCLLSATYTWFRIPETNGLSARSLDILFQHGVSARQFNNATAAQYEQLDREKNTRLTNTASQNSVFSVHAVSSKAQ
ncbi:uncharacterized protein QC763_711250 [Podospora pseudopauciseta]|uniref:Major facilitator superfamily (MFS) profile domain-containing protein n=2 Tax=Podospora TaxID=5144 RepID=A0ABR0H2P9_9PEZI|nr:hypothetical protein QC763_711250 [Podospora pseudopauciseta]KAK4668865.1 hypothetical protein QC764_711250 [Podospora pseudoanserina]